MNQDYKELLKCYKSINNALKELQYELDNKKIALPTYYDKNINIFDNNPNDEIFINSILNNTFYFYYNSWNVLKIKCMKDLIYFNRGLLNNVQKKDKKLGYIPTYNNFENMFNLIKTNINTRYKNNKQNSDKKYIEAIKFHDLSFINEKLKNIITFHNNIWIHTNENLLNELKFYNINVNNKKNKKCESAIKPINESK